MNDRTMRACTEPKSKRSHVARFVSRYLLLALEMRQQTQRVGGKKCSNRLTQLDARSSYRD